MTLVWDAGTAITGAGSAQLLGRFVRVNLTTIPAFLSSSGADPILYGNLGSIGAIVGTARQLGETLRWPTQLIGPFTADADSVWYRLVAGVSGTLYRGQERTMDIPMACQVYNSAAQSAANVTNVAVTFDLEASDPWGMHSAGTNPTRITVPEPGWYDVSGRVTWNNNATGVRVLNVRKNGATVIAGASLSPANFSADWLNHEVSGRAWLDAGDYVELIAYQSSGGSLALNVNNPAASSMTVLRIPG